MSTPHTPGSWSIHPLSGDLAQTDQGWSYRSVYVGAGDKAVAELVMWTTKNGGYPRVDNVEEQDANARLICAAPELLESCKRLCSAVVVHGCAVHDDPRYLDKFQDVLSALREAEAAIAKAEGGS